MTRAPSPESLHQAKLPGRRLIRGVSLVATLALLFVGLVIVGRFTQQRIRTWNRYTIPFSSIDCLAPPGQDRADFLAEVRSQAGLPEQLQILDEKLAERLGEAFAGHPMVERVDSVQLAAQKIVVRLTYRQPQLEVLLADTPRKEERQSQSAAEASWIVDRHGVVLPGKSAEENLPLFIATVPPVGIGKPWGDDSVAAAASTAAFVRPDLQTRGSASWDRLRLKIIEVDAGELILRTFAGTRVLWGHAPGAEVAGEAAAAQKLKRLFEYCDRYGNLDQPGGRLQHDVRPADAASHKPLPSRP